MATQVVTATEAPARTWSKTYVALTLALATVWLVPAVVDIPVPANLIGTTLVILFVGCHRSLKLRDSVSGQRRVQRPLLVV